MERLSTSQNAQAPGSFTPDGSVLAFVEYDQINSDILLVDMKSRRVSPFLKSKAYEQYPEFSPDGRWLAYASDESGRVEVWVRPFPGPGGSWQISKEGGVEPIWSKDGKQLFYRGVDYTGQILSGWSRSKRRKAFRPVSPACFWSRAGSAAQSLPGTGTSGLTGGDS